MKHEKDYLMREVARLTLLLQTLLSGLKEMEETKFEEEFTAMEADLKKEFGFSIAEMAAMDTKSLLQKMAKLPQVHLELWVALLAECIAKTPENIRHKTAAKGLEMIGYLDLNSKTFSFERNSCKVVFKRHLAE